MTAKCHKYKLYERSLFVIASVVHPSTMIAKFLGHPLLVYIGKRSYSLYLWKNLAIIVDG
jgi:peptidoglycan/LPS O-acetylase OafA/YrhL